MKIKTKIIRFAYLVIFTILFSNICIGQIQFEDKFLKIQDGIASTTKYSNVVNYMKENNYTFESKEIDEEDKSEYFTFIGNFKQMVIVSYSKNKDLMFIKSNLLSLHITFCEMELENKKFIKKTTNEEYKGEKWTENQWRKPSTYPFQFMFEVSNDNINWMYLYTSRVETFIKN